MHLVSAFFGQLPVRVERAAILVIPDNPMPFLAALAHVHFENGIELEGRVMAGILAEFWSNPDSKLVQPET
jgi:hypothetical protein